MTLRILPSAVRDLEEIEAWLVRERPGHVGRTLKSLLEGLEQLEHAPMSGPVARDPILSRRGYRTLVRGRYVIFYKTQRRTVFVYRVLHHKRTWAHLI